MVINHRTKEGENEEVKKYAQTLESRESCAESQEPKANNKIHSSTS